MKKLAISLFSLLLLSGCKEKKESAEEVPSTVETNVRDVVEENRDPVNTEENTKSFNIENLPVSDKDLGDFPFFSFPEGLTSTNKPVQKKIDMLYFPIDGVMTPLEGKVWKTYVSVKDNSEEWSLHYFIKSYEDAISKVGGVKIFDGEITYEEYERYHDDAEYLGEDGSIGYMGQKIKVYAIHRADGGNIFIQFCGDSAAGNLNVLQQEPFKQTISIIKSDKILKDLEEKGKVVLYVNFDLDKATLQPNGKQAVDEIAKALKDNNQLKIDIQGYTDNSGSDEHNQKLSENRASTVLNTLTSLGIDKSRLSSKGFGSQNPVADNSTEEGRAKNRRVELIKK
ncbi:OmpA family protein [Flavobacterium rakeshii]|uniref:OmpA family protein n=1 Tax=Flavobacterium rakeshii TaxID=1038845 RepID=A0A6N8HG80_9FLAO|nr:OmpA family protein [Flavobacterium rakeshii]MUV04713.1 OmpA family protein [Flavobacterium rakeshii]